MAGRPGLKKVQYSDSSSQLQGSTCEEVALCAESASAQFFVVNVFIEEELIRTAEWMQSSIDEHIC